jgi:hypothetical protein
VAVDRVHSLAIRHCDSRGSEGGDLDGSEACGDQSEDGSIAQPHGSAGAHPAWIDARQESVCLFGIETHQCGSNPAGAGICGFWDGRFSMGVLRSSEIRMHQGTQDSKRSRFLDSSQPSQLNRLKGQRIEAGVWTSSFQIRFWPTGLAEPLRGGTGGRRCKASPRRGTDDRRCPPMRMEWRGPEGGRRGGPLIPASLPVGPVSAAQSVALT